MSETNRIFCPNCGQTYAIQPEQWSQYLGKTIPCSKCGNFFVLEAPALASVPPPLPAPLPAAGYQTPPYPGSDQRPGETSGIAVASMVLGILSFVVPIILSIPAIICAAFGMTRTRDSRVGGRGFALAGLIMGICSLLMSACLLSIMFPALHRARGMANEVKCAANMRRIGLAIMMYSNHEKDGSFPDTLDQLVKDGSLTGSDLVCPASKHSHMATSSNAINAIPGSGIQSSYIYLGAGLTNQTSGDTVILYEPIEDHLAGANFLYADGRVQFLQRNQAAQTMARLGARRPDR